MSAEKIAASHDPSCGLVAAIESSFISGEYSDLIIQCNGRIFKAHKLIVCGQSKWFANAVKKDVFQEGQSGVIDLPCDDPAAVKAMLQFLYTFDYDVPSDIYESITNHNLHSLKAAVPERLFESKTNEGPSTESSPGKFVVSDEGTFTPESYSTQLWKLHHQVEQMEMAEAGAAGTELQQAVNLQPEYDSRALPPMLFHINVYALADRIQNRPLKVLAERKFEALAKDDWKSPDFPAAIEAIYSVAPPGTTGDSLRKMIVRLVVSHAKELFTKDRGFTAMLPFAPEFAADLGKALSGAGISGKGPEVNLDVEELCCPGCKFVMRATLPPGLNNLVCPLCRWDGIVAIWRHGLKDQGQLRKGRKSVLTNSWEL